MSEEQMSVGQWSDHDARFRGPLVRTSIGEKSYQELREYPPYLEARRQLEEACRLFVAQRDRVSPHLSVNALPRYHTRANTALVYDWSQRSSEEERLERIARVFIGAGLGITEVVLVDSVVPMPGWPSCLVVSPVDALIQGGVDPEKVTPKQYCRLIKPLCHSLPGVTVGDYLDSCINDEGVRLEAETLAAWLTLPTTQEKNQPLIVRRMAVNPAVWFDFSGMIYSFAPLHTPTMFANLPATNKIKRVLPGDLIVTASLYIGEPHLISQIKTGTCPRSDIPGTETRSDGGWSFRPYLRRRGGGAWLGDGWAGSADGYFGSVGCAGE